MSYDYPEVPFNEEVLSQLVKNQLEILDGEASLFEEIFSRVKIKLFTPPPQPQRVIFPLFEFLPPDFPSIENRLDFPSIENRIVLICFVQYQEYEFWQLAYENSK